MSSEYFENELKIRRMVEADIKFVKYLESACGLSYWSVEDYRASLKKEDYIALVAQYSEKIVGFIMARLITTEGSQLHSKEFENIFEIEIYNIAVDAKFRRKGIGRRFLEKCLELQKTSARIIFQLDVRKSNAEAIEFYAKQGFIVRGVRKNFYNNPSEDALFMSLVKNNKT